MDAETLLSNGMVKEAYADLANTVRNHPDESRHRIFMFQLQCILAKWEQALTQLKILAELDDSYDSLVRTYSTVIACEITRERVFKGESSPLIFGDPKEWIARMSLVPSCLKDSNFESAKELIASSFEEAETTAGQIDEQAFDWIADADMRLGPLFEIILDGKYYWAPYTSVKYIKFDAVEDLRDTVWRPVSLTWANGGESVGFMPARYPGINADTSSAQQMLSRETSWSTLAEGFYQGQGQKVLCTESEEYAILDVQTIAIH